MKLFPSITGPRRTALQAGALVVTMGSLSFAAVPFYDWFCRVTGYGGATGVAEAAPGAVPGETIVVRFDASLDREMPWQFRPVEREMVVRLGEENLAFYEAHNPTSRPVAGSASYNVTPDTAGGYFMKIACFCFEEQVLQPGETVLMPVSFYVDPEIVNDPEGQFVRVITLSYTFYEQELQAALDPVPTGPLTAPAAPAIDMN
jgi:cytochrome c oxidase assembly protein subunit 11